MLCHHDLTANSHILFIPPFLSSFEGVIVGSRRYGPIRRGRTQSDQTSHPGSATFYQILPLPITELNQLKDQLIAKKNGTSVRLVQIGGTLCHSNTRQSDLVISLHISIMGNQQML